MPASRPAPLPNPLLRPAGKCKSGFCHCDKGWWGTGCTRSKAYALAPHSRAVPSRTQLRIYMYDLPADVAYAGEFDDGATTRDAMYTAYEYFFKYFLTDWAVRTGACVWWWYLGWWLGYMALLRGNGRLD